MVLFAQLFDMIWKTLKNETSNEEFPSKIETPQYQLPSFPITCVFAATTESFPDSSASK